MDRDEEFEAEELVPRNYAVLGLKVADQEEADTVRKVGYAVIALTGFLVLHFLVHVANYGHLVHSFVHLMAGAGFPLVGYFAVSQRSTRATWGFHITAVLSSIAHLIVLIIFFHHLVELMEIANDSECAKFAHPCAQSMPTLSFSADRSAWRCGSGYCIEGSGYCDGLPQCFDGSDEDKCPQPHAMLKRDIMEWDQLRWRCYDEQMELQNSRVLRWWWLLISVPMECLCLFAAYYSLEFYVQLRLRKLSARVDGRGDATVFDADRQENDEGAAE